VVYGTNFGPSTLAGLQFTQDGKVSSSVAQTRVLFDGVPAPVVYSGAGQTSVVVPYSVALQRTTKMIVEYQGRRSDPVILDVVRTAPGLFSANSSGTGPGAILNNQNGTVNTTSNPIAKGSVAVLFGTGEGSTNPSVPDGSVTAAIVTPDLPVSV